MGWRTALYGPLSDDPASSCGQIGVARLRLEPYLPQSSAGVPLHNSVPHPTKGE